MNTITFFFSIFDDKCKADNNRCQIVVTGNAHEHVVFETSAFNGFKNEDNGGANCYVNCGVTLNKEKFIQCQSTKAGGGAIFIMNDLDLVNRITLENIEIESCSAVFGGAAYIYASSPNNQVRVTVSEEECFNFWYLIWWFSLPYNQRRRSRPLRVYGKRWWRFEI